MHCRTTALVNTRKRERAGSSASAQGLWPSPINGLRHRSRQAEARALITTACLQRRRQAQAPLLVLGELKAAG